MQIVRTEIVNATALNGQPILRVVFCGEGSECVSVDMANVDGGGDEILNRAKAMLVQTATFGLAPNTYDANSNGNFDEVAVTSASDFSGEVYVFEYRDGESSRRIPPSRMPSLEAAPFAVPLISWQPGTDELSGWLVRISDENGEMLYSVDVAQADAARQSLNNP